MSSHRCTVCRVRSVSSVNPRSTRIRTVWVPSSALTLASSGIFFGSPPFAYAHWTISSTHVCPAARSFGAISQKAASPSQTSLHCSFSMCHMPSSHEDLHPPMASIRLRSLRSSRVASAQLVPPVSLRSVTVGCQAISMFKSCMHLATLAHFVSSVWSHFHSFISCCRSCSEAHAHLSNVWSNSHCEICLATSSCLMLR